MSDDIFRIAIVVGVGLASLAFIVQAFVAFALYGRVKKMQEKMGPVVDSAKPLIAKAEPMVDRVSALLEKAGPNVEKIGPAVEKAGAAAEQAKALLRRAEQILASVNRVIDDSRPRIATFSDEAIEIARSGREQVERMGNLLHDASEKARERLTQIDQTVESTIEQVGQASNAMKHAVMKPVREVNGLAAGISAVVSTLVKGTRKSSVDTAVQDEEMFI
jgi:methyl-accepting chemotaxis protein